MFITLKNYNTSTNKESRVIVNADSIVYMDSRGNDRTMVYFQHRQLLVSETQAEIMEIIGEVGGKDKVGWG